jgi:hypothetical protein
LPADPAKAKLGISTPVDTDLAGGPRISGPELDVGALEQFSCSATFMLDPDWINFVECQTGPDGVLNGGVCACYDTDLDGDIDVLDYGVIQAEFGN